MIGLLRMDAEPDIFLGLLSFLSSVCINKPDLWQIVFFTGLNFIQACFFVYEVK